MLTEGTFEFEPGPAKMDWTSGELPLNPSSELSWVMACRLSIVTPYIFFGVLETAVAKVLSNDGCDSSSGFIN